MGEACFVENSAPTGTSCVRISAPSETTLQWFALKVRIGGELRTAQNLEARNFVPYCPFRVDRRQYSDRMKEIRVAVFPGYLFCQFEATQRTEILSSPGVEYLVGFAGVPVPIPDLEVFSIQKAIEGGAVVTPNLFKGQKVRVVRGPMSGVEGILLRSGQQGQLAVSIELLSQSATLQVPYSDVAILSEVA